jgi:hypothetical protein
MVLRYRRAKLRGLEIPDHGIKVEGRDWGGQDMLSEFTLGSGGGCGHRVVHGDAWRLTAGERYRGGRAATSNECGQAPVEVYKVNGVTILERESRQRVNSNNTVPESEDAFLYGLPACLV